jgi:hypothetical protein
MHSEPEYRKPMPAKPLAYDLLFSFMRTHVSRRAWRVDLVSPRGAASMPYSTAQHSTAQHSTEQLMVHTIHDIIAQCDDARQTAACMCPAAGIDR